MSETKQQKIIVKTIAVTLLAVGLLLSVAINVYYAQTNLALNADNNSVVSDNNHMREAITSYRLYTQSVEDYMRLTHQSLTSIENGNSDLSQLYDIFGNVVEWNITEIKLDGTWHLVRIDHFPENTVPLSVAIYTNGTSHAAQLYFGVINSSANGKVSKVFLIPDQ